MRDDLRLLWLLSWLHSGHFLELRKRIQNRIIIIDELPSWLKKVKNKEWKYNFINEEWKLISKDWFDYVDKFFDWYAAIYIEWKW